MYLPAMEDTLVTKTFFTEEVPVLLAGLQPNSRPAWGTMNAIEMLAHLEAGLRISMEDVERPIMIPVDKIDRYQAFLRSDKSFPAGSPKPQEYAAYELQFESLEAARLQLLKTVEDFLHFWRDQPHFTSVHPHFGRLDQIHWLHLHRKHFRHHFVQFGLMEAPELPV